MINSVKIKIIFFVTIIITSCSHNNCREINTNFTSYKNAIELVRETDFNIEEKVNTDSSWIESIEYYSCDEAFGFLIVNTKKGGSYIHKNVPIQVWNDFKNANSFGRFYNQNLKGNYHININ